MRPRLRRLFVEYQAYHLDPVNLAIHKVAVPAILFHVVVMLDWVGTGVELGGYQVTLGWVLCILAGLWYIALSPRYALMVVPFAFASLWVGRSTPRATVIAIAAVAWVAQLVGHVRFERKAPAFTDNLLQLLVGPAYISSVLLGDWPERED